MLKRIAIRPQQIDGDTLGDVVLSLVTIVWSLGGSATEQVEAMLKYNGIKYEVTEVTSV